MFGVKWNINDEIGLVIDEQPFDNPHVSLD